MKENVAVGDQPAKLQATLVIDQPAGVVRINASAAATASMPSGSWPYDLWLNLAGGIRMCLADGHFTVRANVTKVSP